MLTQAKATTRVGFAICSPRQRLAEAPAFTVQGHRSEPRFVVPDVSSPMS